jgi:hypothetical protein
VGAEPWCYFVPYRPDIGKALQELRRREFEAGRYNPVREFPEFPPDPSAPGPGAGHATIQEALEASGADGTRSILDMDRSGETPDCGVVTHMPEGLVFDLFGTPQPTREAIEDGRGAASVMERGQGMYNGSPAEILFVGMSCD